ncbi:ABC transporter ATP-binding protein [Achromobacter sp. UMC46]|uniref:ABC transporter ATP-binding protein n=1 Tax=Achromobacter sp. UMC46 TaxID=1862319 RepID=UPI0016036E35|nr:ABC transporter ATP-binding protein [Achromobacter sp. UMC46]MBB1593791.1 ABC transporter ATP-binding protein [Achromobacter sp. UMC46]
MLEIKNLHAAYGRLAALKGVDIHVPAGSIVFVVGPNGAGKSTLLKSIAGVVKPAEGSIDFEGVRINGRPPERLCRDGLVLVPEGRHIFGTLTVEENLKLAMSARKNKAEAATDLAQALDAFPILRERYQGAAGYLSGGEQQQLAIARAMLLRPRLLMIDEPSLGLAPLVIDQVYDKLRMLNASGMTLLVVEQSTARVMDLATHVYVLRNGKVALDCEARQIGDGRALENAYFGYETTAEAEAA